MSKIKKLIALTLALAMVLSVSAFAGYSADTYADAAKINEDCESAVELMYALDIMKGNEKGEFMPEKAVTRAEMAKIIYVILNYGDDDGATNYLGNKFFTDVEAGNWAEGYINYCAATKLIAGRGNGTFDPTAPVTTAEAAKMMLTAIGYNAEARGYVGDKWSDNTLADAATIGLLAGYKANVLEAAPRQWIAVMLENLLVDAYTYINMAPAFSGLLTSGFDMGITTMGAKYYDLASFSSVAIATNKAYIDVTDLLDCDEDHKHEDDCYVTSGKAAKDKVLFANGVQLKKTGLKTPDLGQKYRVIYNADDMTAYSVRSLGATGVARDYEAEVDIKHATSGNQPNNKYVFTIGDVEGTLALDDNGEFNYLTSTADAPSTMTPAELRDLIDEAYKSANTIKAIDSEDDGDIDYLYITEYAYGYVTEVATSEKYGKYINVAALSTEEDEEPVMLTYAGGDNLYLKDCIITDDEIEEDEIVKISYDIDADKYVVEVLPQVKGVEYEEYDDDEMIFVLGDKEYFVAETEIAEDAEAAYDYEEEILAVLTDDDNLGEKYNVVYDGDLIVYIWQDDDRYDSMDKVNEQLALVLDAENDYSEGSLREYNAIEYMTIDGKTHIAKYIDKSTDADEDGELDYVQFEEIEHLEAIANLEDDTMEYTVEGRLFKLYTTANGVYLEKLENDTINAQLKVKKTVLNGYEEDDGYTVDATGSAIKVITPDEETYKVDADNKYFVGMYDDGDPVYKVMTLEELKNCIDEDAYVQILTYENVKGTRTTVVGGYLFLELESDTAADYLYIAKKGRINGDGRKCDVVFADGTKKSVTIVEKWKDANGETVEIDLVEDVLYKYVYNFMADEYKVTLVEMPEQENEIVDFDDDNIVWVDEGEEFELEDEVIAIVTIEVDRDRDYADDDTPAFELVNKGIKFVELKDLKLDMIENDVDNKTYTQYTDYLRVYDEENKDYLFYVADFQIMDTAQEIADELPEQLAEILEAVLAGEKTYVIAE